MVNPDLQLFDENPEWGLLLAAYQAQHAAGREWVARLVAVDPLPADRLSVLHGKLIAIGLLKFEISSRTEGMQYQVTQFGRQALQPPEARAAVPEWLQADGAEAAA